MKIVDVIEKVFQVCMLKQTAPSFLECLVLHEPFSLYVEMLVHPTPRYQLLVKVRFKTVPGCCYNQVN